MPLSPRYQSPRLLQISVTPDLDLLRIYWLLSNRKYAKAYVNFAYYFPLILGYYLMLNRQFTQVYFIGILLLSLNCPIFYKVFADEAQTDNVFITFCTYALMKTLASADFLMTVSNITYIYESICLFMIRISSFRQSKAFFETLDLRF